MPSKKNSKIVITQVASRSKSKSKSQTESKSKAHAKPQAKQLTKSKSHVSPQVARKTTTKASERASAIVKSTTAGKSKNSSGKAAATVSKKTAAAVKSKSVSKVASKPSVRKTPQVKESAKILTKTAAVKSPAPKIAASAAANAKLVSKAPKKNQTTEVKPLSKKMAVKSSDVAPTKVKISATQPSKVTKVAPAVVNTKTTGRATSETAAAVPTATDSGAGVNSTIGKNVKSAAPVKKPISNPKVSSSTRLKNELSSAPVPRVMATPRVALASGSSATKSTIPGSTSPESFPQAANDRTQVTQKKPSSAVTSVATDTPISAASSSATAQSKLAPAAPKATPTKSGVHRTGYKVNEFIVYPAHGVGQIIAIEEQEVAGFKLELFVINFMKDKMTLKVPMPKVVAGAIRKLADAEMVKKALDILTGRARIKRTMWSRRAQEYEAKINSGDLSSIAEVVRDLYRSEAQPEQSYSERQLYEAALDRIVREIAVVQKVTETEALKLIEAQLQRGPRRGSKAEAQEEPAEGEADGDVDEAA